MSTRPENPWDDITRKWQELYEQQARLGQGWLEAQTQMANAVGASSSTPSDLADIWRTGMPGLPNAGAAGLSQAFEAMHLPLMGGNHVTDVIRRVTQAPQLADAGAFERRTAHLVELFVDVQTASRAYEAQIAQAWAEANQGFAAAMAGSATDPGALAPRAALRTWLASADEVFTKLQRSADFLETQRRLMRAGIDYLLAEREVFELLVAPAGLPTRSEVDELHLTVQKLKRRIRVLERAGAGGPGEDDA